jgi:polyhydroxyalkanoate synthase
MFAGVDIFRRLQGDALAQFGLGPAECAYRVVASGAGWRLRAYAGPGATHHVLIIAAPIKRPYIWDLAPSVSAVRRCLENRLGVHLLEWLPPKPGDTKAGLEQYAGRAIGEAVAACSRAVGGAKPFLIGHSMGGTLAAIFSAARPASISGLVLLSSPLCFAPGCSRFRDNLVAIAPSVAGLEIVPGTFLSQLSAIASPNTFVWSRLADAGFCLGNPAALEVHARVERWSLDEFPLSGRLVDETLQWLYREDRFCRGTLRIGGKPVGPSSLQAPVLAVVNAADEIAPRRSVLPFLEQMPKGRGRLLEHPGEHGVGFQHLAPLIGRHAHASLWPEVISWIERRG